MVTTAGVGNAPGTDGTGRPAAEPGSSPPRPSPRPRPTPAPPATPAPVAEEDESLPEEEPQGLPQRRVLGVIGSIIAPTTVLTALLFYFGMLHAHWFFDYFGVNYTVLGLTTQDFLIRSADGLFVPLTALAAVTLVGLWGFRSADRWLPERARRALRWAAGPAAAATGTALVLVAVVAIIIPEAFASTLGLPGLCLALGVALLSAVSPLLRLRTPDADHRSVPPAVAIGEWAASFVLVSVGLFWAAGDYSAAVGTGRGMAVAAGLSRSADVVLFSEKSLRIESPGVVESTCTGHDLAFGFRYSGLKLVMQAGDRYVLLPARWSRADGAALVVPRTDAIRLEFMAPGEAQRGTC
jgi:hypothetical protein